jgi:hypothetical protein
MNKFEEETIAALTLLMAKVAELELMSVREMLTPGRYDQFKETLDEAYDALVTVEDSLDSLGLKLEYQHWRISSAFEELTPFLMQTRSRADIVLDTFEQDMRRKERKFQQPQLPAPQTNYCAMCHYKGA